MASEENYESISELLEIRKKFSKFVTPLTDELVKLFKSKRGLTYGFFGGNSWHENFSLKVGYDALFDSFNPPKNRTSILDTFEKTINTIHSRYLTKEGKKIYKLDFDVSKMFVKIPFKRIDELIRANVTNILPILMSLRGRIDTQVDIDSISIYCFFIMYFLIKQIFIVCNIVDTEKIDQIMNILVRSIHETIYSIFTRNIDTVNVNFDDMKSFCPSIDDDISTICKISPLDEIKSSCVLKGNVDVLVQCTDTIYGELIAQIKQTVTTFSQIPEMTNYTIDFIEENETKFRLFSNGVAIHLVLNTKVDDSDPSKLLVPGKNERSLMYLERSNDVTTFLSDAQIFFPETKYLTPFGNSIAACCISTSRTSEKGGLNVDEVRDELLQKYTPTKKGVMLKFFKDDYLRLFTPETPETPDYNFKRSNVMVALIQKHGIIDGKSYKDVLSEFEHKILCIRGDRIRGDNCVSFRSAVQSVETMMEKLDTGARYEASGGDMVSRYICKVTEGSFYSADIDCKVKCLQNQKEDKLEKFIIILSYIVKYFNKSRLFADDNQSYEGITMDGFDGTMTLKILSSKQESFLSLRCLRNFMGKIDLLSIDLTLNCTISFDGESDTTKLKTRLKLSPFDLSFKSETPGVIAKLKTSLPNQIFSKVKYPLFHNAKNDGKVKVTKKEDGTFTIEDYDKDTTKEEDSCYVYYATPLPTLDDCIDEVTRLTTDAKEERMATGKHQKDLRRLKLLSEAKEAKLQIRYDCPTLIDLEQMVEVSDDQYRSLRQLLQTCSDIWRIPKLSYKRYSVSTHPTWVKTDTWLDFTNYFNEDELYAISYMLSKQKIAKRSSKAVTISFTKQKIQLYKTELDPGITNMLEQQPRETRSRTRSNRVAVTEARTRSNRGAVTEARTRQLSLEDLKAKVKERREKARINAFSPPSVSSLPSVSSVSSLPSVSSVSSVSSLPSVSSVSSVSSLSNFPIPPVSEAQMVDETPSFPIPPVSGSHIPLAQGAQMVDHPTPTQVRSRKRERDDMDTSDDSAAHTDIVPYPMELDDNDSAKKKKKTGGKRSRKIKKKSKRKKNKNKNKTSRCK